MFPISHTGSAATCVLREADGQRRAEDFLLEEIFLVEEEDDGGVAEPFVVADRVEELQALLHPVLKRKHCPDEVEDIYSCFLHFHIQ